MMQGLLIYRLRQYEDLQQLLFIRSLEWRCFCVQHTKRQFFRVLPHYDRVPTIGGI